MSITKITRNSYLPKNKIEYNVYLVYTKIVIFLPANLHHREVINMFLFLCVIVTICFSLMDFSGLKIHIQKQYRTSPYLKRYQIINGVLELIFALCGIFYMFDEKFQIKENLILYIVFDVLIIAVIILRGLNSRYFIKKSKKLNKKQL